ncbi:MAG: peptide chain release factor N(5)-glutamine methyltransferase, partial [Thalassococcus sp.]|nr:peptide chain release factor N(5)-glutamine methyltransferase [Thalassococcus sp.]
MTGSEILAEATRKLVDAGIPDAGRDARRLLAHVLKVPMGRLTLFLPEDVDPELTVISRVLIERRT